MTEDNNVLLNGESGDINISNDVVSVIASMAAGGISGVASLNASIGAGFAELLGKKNLSKGVKVDIKEKNVDVDLYITVEYGAIIPDVAWNVQSKVKSEIESMTGLTVNAVNVHVEGVNVPHEAKGAGAPPENESEEESGNE